MVAVAVTVGSVGTTIDGSADDTDGRDGFLTVNMGGFLTVNMGGFLTVNMGGFLTVDTNVFLIFLNPFPVLPEREPETDTDDVDDTGWCRGDRDRDAERLLSLWFGDFDLARHVFLFCFWIGTHVEVLLTEFEGTPVVDADAVGCTIDNFNGSHAADPDAVHGSFVSIGVSSFFFLSNGCTSTLSDFRL